MRFKRKAILLAMLVSVSSVAMSQSTTTKKDLVTTFGVKGGANLSNLYVKDVNDENSKLGFQVGLFAKAPITSAFSIQPELIYTQKGTELEYNNLFANGKASFNLQYVELPIMGVINLTKNFNIQAGVYASYLAAVKVKNKATNGSYDFEREVNKANFQEFDFGLAGGVGFDADKVGLGLRYNYGLREVGKNKQVFGQNYNFNNGKNSVLQLYLTLGF